MRQHTFSPVDYGGITLKNRIVFAPTSFGLPEEAYVGKIREIASGGCAMMVIGDVPVSRHAPGSLFSKKGFERYRTLVDAIHEGGAVACAQLHQSDSDILGMIRYIPGVLFGRTSPDDLRKILNDRVGDYVTNMPASKVEGIIASFGTAARRAMEAGFDVIQVHGDRMCGSFSSALFNKRTDRFGGDAEGRMRFAVEAVERVREAVPDVPIDYKLAVRQESPHHGNAGVLEEELPAFVPALVDAGVTSFHVTLANHGDLGDTIPSRSHSDFSGEGCFLRFCDEVRALTDVPITGVGGLVHPDFVEEQIASGRIDCAAMSRQLIADPAWPRKVESGHEDVVRFCIRCNKDCLGGIQRHEGVHCVFDGRE